MHYCLLKCVSGRRCNHTICSWRSKCSKVGSWWDEKNAGNVIAERVSARHAITLVSPRRRSAALGSTSGSSALRSQIELVDFQPGSVAYRVSLDFVRFKRPVRQTDSLPRNNCSALWRLCDIVQHASATFFRKSLLLLCYSRRHADNCCVGEQSWTIRRRMRLDGKVIIIILTLKLHVKISESTTLLQSTSYYKKILNVYTYTIFLRSHELSSSITFVIRYYICFWSYNS